MAGIENIRMVMEGLLSKEGFPCQDKYLLLPFAITRLFSFPTFAGSAGLGEAYPPPTAGENTGIGA